MKMTLKVEILLVFSVRLPTVALSILHLQSLFSLQRSEDPQLDISTSLVCLQVMLIWSVFSATIPNMRAFIKSFHSRLGMPAGPANVESLSLKQALRTIRQEEGSPKCSQPINGDEGGGSQPSSRPDIGRTTTTASHGDTHTRSATMAEDRQYIGENWSKSVTISKDLQWGLWFSKTDVSQWTCCMWGRGGKEVRDSGQI